MASYRRPEASFGSVTVLVGRFSAVRAYASCFAFPSVTAHFIFPFLVPQMLEVSFEVLSSVVENS
jgi:hypothetical protein